MDTSTSQPTASPAPVMATPKQSKTDRKATVVQSPRCTPAHGMTSPKLASAGTVGAGTTRPDTPRLDGGTPLPKALPGGASATRESLGALFARVGAEHFAGGFRGGSNDDPGSDIPKDESTRPDAEDDVTAG